MHCLSCGYDLQQLEDHRCPECGRRFDAEDPKSWSTAKAYRYAKPAKITGWTAVVLTLLFTGFLTRQITIGEDDGLAVMIYWFLAAIPLMTLLMIWMGCLAKCQRDPSRRARWTLVVLFLLNLSLVLQWPIDVSFALHRNALNQQVQLALAGSSPVAPYRIGIYQVQDTRIINTKSGPAAVALKIDGGSGPDYFAYGLTDQEIESNFNIWSYKRLDNNWHIVHED